MRRAVIANLSDDSKPHLARTASSIGCVQWLVQENNRRASPASEWVLEELAVVASCALELESANLSVCLSPTVTSVEACLVSAHEVMALPLGALA